MENNELENESLSLLRKAYINFKSSKIVQKLAALSVASALVFSLGACEPNSTPDIDGANTNGGNEVTNGGNGTSGNHQEIDVSGYSQILQNILKNEEYNAMKSEAFGKDGSLLETGFFEPHPYAFYEDKGFDVEAIKNDEIDAYTMSYVLEEEPNNLYMYTRVASEDDSYYSIYLLKYALTDEEMEDYHYLHNQDGNNAFYIESVFMNNEISKTREPIVVGESQITKNAFEKMTKSLQRVHLYENKALDMIFLNPNQSEETFKLIFLPRYYEERKMCFENLIISADCSAIDMYYKDGIFNGPTNYGSGYQAINRTDKTAIFYFSQDAKVSIIACGSLNTINLQ